MSSRAVSFAALLQRATSAGQSGPAFAGSTADPASGTTIEPSRSPTTAPRRSRNSSTRSPEKRSARTSPRSGSTVACAVCRALEHGLDVDEHRRAAARARASPPTWSRPRRSRDPHDRIARTGLAGSHPASAGDEEAKNRIHTAAIRIARMPYLSCKRRQVSSRRRLALRCSCRVSHPPPQPRARRRHRRRHHRLLGRLPPRAHGLEGRRAARARPADLRHDLARGRADRHVRLDVRDLDRDAQVHARSLRAARGRDRAVDRLQAGRLHRGRRPIAIGSRSTAASRRSTATAASTSTRSRRAQVKELFPLAQHRRHPRRLLRQGRRPRRIRSTSRWRSRRARACRARRSSRASPVTGVTHEARRGHRRRRPRTATSSASTSSTAPACGRASSARRPASTSRCRRPSTTT